MSARSELRNNIFWQLFDVWQNPKNLPLDFASEGAEAILAIPEIQRLLTLDDEIERLRAAGDALAAQITQPCRCVEAADGAINETCAPCAAVFRWEEVT